MKKKIRKEMQVNQPRGINQKWESAN